MTGKRGISPIIATVLLIMIVIVLAAIIFLWARGFVEEKAQKFGRAVELSCDDVFFEAGVFPGIGGDYVLDVVNRGNVPLYGMIVKKTSEGSVEIKSEVFGNTVGVGDSVSINLGQAVGSGDELLIVPVILGETDAGKVSHTCGDETGEEVTVD